MNEDKIEGVVRNGVGHVQDAAGGLTGDGETQAKGKINQLAGSAQGLVGDLKDNATSAFGAVAEQTTSVYSGVEATLKDRPLVTLGIGVGIGFALAMLFTNLD